MNVTAKLFGGVFGAVYLAIGLIGFAVTGFDGFVATEGDVLIAFELNPLHNLVHIGVGAALLGAAAASERAAQEVALLIGAVYGVVGVIGFFLLDTSANILALNIADNLLHVTTAALAFATVYLARQQRVATV